MLIPTQVTVIIEETAHLRESYNWQFFLEQYKKSVSQKRSVMKFRTGTFYTGGWFWVGGRVL